LILFFVHILFKLVFILVFILFLFLFFLFLFLFFLFLFFFLFFLFFLVLVILIIIFIVFFTQAFDEVVSQGRNLVGVGGERVDLFFAAYVNAQHVLVALGGPHSDGVLPWPVGDAREEPVVLSQVVGVQVGVTLRTLKPRRE